MHKFNVQSRLSNAPIWLYMGMPLGAKGDDYLWSYEPEQIQYNTYTFARPNSVNHDQTAPESDEGLLCLSFQIYTLHTKSYQSQFHQLLYGIF